MKVFLDRLKNRALLQHGESLQIKVVPQQGPDMFVYTTITPPGPLLRTENPNSYSKFTGKVLTEEDWTIILNLPWRKQATLVRELKDRKNNPPKKREITLAVVGSINRTFRNNKSPYRLRVSQRSRDSEEGHYAIVHVS